MNFINSEVDVASLPLVEEVRLQPAHPHYKKVLYIECFITSIVLMVVAGIVIISSEGLLRSYGWLAVVASMVLLCSFYYLAIQKSFPFLAYAVREKDVIHQKGWIIRRIKTCPFNRIQNCSVQSGPLERRYGLASLVVYTAGADGADIRISGLLHEEAEQLRHFILSKIHNEPDEAA